MQRPVQIFSCPTADDRQLPAHGPDSSEPHLEAVVRRDICIASAISPGTSSTTVNHSLDATAITAASAVVASSSSVIATISAGSLTPIPPGANGARNPAM